MLDFNHVDWALHWQPLISDNLTITYICSHTSIWVNDDEPVDR